MTSGREITPPPGFSIVPTTTTMFAATTPENTPLAYRASTSANLNLMISLAFVEANYEALEGESRVERNNEGGRPSEEASRGNGGQNVNLPPLLAAHIKRSENGQPLQSSLTSAYGGQALPSNIGVNLPLNAHRIPFANSDAKLPNMGKQPPTWRAHTIDLHKQ
ncbi:hypothetical protein Tco_1328771 [Tanacetum coccineum]